MCMYVPLDWSTNFQMFKRQIEPFLGTSNSIGIPWADKDQITWKIMFVRIALLRYGCRDDQRKYNVDLTIQFNKYLVPIQATAVYGDSCGSFHAMAEVRGSRFKHDWFGFELTCPSCSYDRYHISFWTEGAKSTIGIIVGNIFLPNSWNAGRCIGILQNPVPGTCFFRYAVDRVGDISFHGRNGPSRYFLVFLTDSICGYSHPKFIYDSTSGPRVQVFCCSALSHTAWCCPSAVDSLIYLSPLPSNVTLIRLFYVQGIA